MLIVNGTTVQASSSSPTSSAVTPIRWRHVCPGDPLQLSHLWRWLASLLPDCPARDDLLLVAVELGTNAVRHTRSGADGRFAVEITWYGSAVRITVAHDGSSSRPHLVGEPTAEHGRGLHLVRRLSMGTGATGDHRGRVIWADLPWPGPGNDMPAAFSAAFKERIRDGQADVRRRFPGTCTWFGRTTLQWGALPTRSGSAEGFVCAAWAEGLADRLIDQQRRGSGAVS